MKGKKQTNKAKEKIRKFQEERIKKLHPEWNGEISNLYHRIRHSFEYHQWRYRVFIRDYFICQECGEKKRGIQADHIKPFSFIIKENKIKTLRQAINCEELWNISNGRTLCTPCHRQTNTYGAKIKMNSSFLEEKQNEGEFTRGISVVAS